MKKRNNDQNPKMTLRERLKDKRERAKIELTIYGIFFIGVIIFTRLLGETTNSANNKDITNSETPSFVETIKDNYEYDIQIAKGEDIYHYYGKVLGNNSTINLEKDDEVISYIKMNKKYYILDNGNYILTDEKEIYPYIDSRYLNINNIKEYIKIASKENNTYKVKISDIVLNSNEEAYLTINIEEGDKNIIINYTQLFKVLEENAEEVTVNITYSNINNIVSLEE